jgi:hypothetical protein
VRLVVVAARGRATRRQTPARLEAVCAVREGGPMSQYGDGDPVDVCESEWRKARKLHTCSACSEAISPSQKYHRTAILFEGQWQITARCERCEAIFRHLVAKIQKRGECDEYCDMELNCGHEYRERWNEDPPPEIAALAFWRPGDPLP